MNLLTINLIAKIVEDQIVESLSKKCPYFQIGMILINHGCPPKTKKFTSRIYESKASYELARERLVNRDSLISVGWLNYQTPMIKWTQLNADLATKVSVYYHWIRDRKP